MVFIISRTPRRYTHSNHTSVPLTSFCTWATGRLCRLSAAGRRVTRSRLRTRRKRVRPTVGTSARLPRRTLSTVQIKPNSFLRSIDIFISIRLRYRGHVIDKYSTFTRKRTTTTKHCAENPFFKFFAKTDMRARRQRFRNYRITPNIYV